MEWLAFAAGVGVGMVGGVGLVLAVSLLLADDDPEAEPRPGRRIPPTGGSGTAPPRHERRHILPPRGRSVLFDQRGE